MENIAGLYNDLVEIVGLFQNNEDKSKVVFAIYLIRNRWIENSDDEEIVYIDGILKDILLGEIKFRDIPQNIISIIDTIKENHPELGEDERDKNAIEIEVLKEGNDESEGD